MSILNDPELQGYVTGVIVSITIANLFMALDVSHLKHRKMISWVVSWGLLALFVIVHALGVSFVRLSGASILMCWLAYPVCRRLKAHGDRVREARMAELRAEMEHTRAGHEAYLAVMAERPVSKISPATKTRED